MYFVLATSNEKGSRDKSTRAFSIIVLQHRVQPGC